MSIYIPFTYLIGWSNHYKFYYGSKYAQGCSPIDLWTTYFTSSKEVARFREEFGEPDIIEIRKTFKNSSDCLLWEHKVLRRMKANINDRFLNKSNGGLNWNNVKGKVLVKDKDGNALFVDLNDPRYISKELIPFNVGRKLSEEHKNLLKRKRVGHQPNKNKKFNEEWRKNMSKARKGVPKTEEHKQKLRRPKNVEQREKRICPKCGKIGSGGNMVRYHFDNCGIERPKLECPVCGKLIEGKGNLKQHMRSSFCIEGTAQESDLIIV